MITDKKQKAKSNLELALIARKEGRYNDYVSIIKKESDPECVYLLGMCYWNGDYKFKENQEEAFELFNKNIQFNHYQSMAKVACYLVTWEKNIKYAKTLVRKILKSIGNYNAKAYCYYHILVISKDQFNYVKEYLLPAAEEGDDECQNILARCFEIGDRVDKDKTKAVEWFLKSAEQGNKSSQQKLGELYSKMDDNPEHYEKSIYWNKKYYDSTGDDYYLIRSLGLMCSLQDLYNDYDYDQFINFDLGEYYLEQKNEYLSWYFYKKVKEKYGSLETYNGTIFKKFINCKKAILTVLCIGKYIKQRDIFTIIAKELWKTKNEIDWN